MKKTLYMPIFIGDQEGHDIEYLVEFEDDYSSGSGDVDWGVATISMITYGPTGPIGEAEITEDHWLYSRLLTDIITRQRSYIDDEWSDYLAGEGKGAREHQYHSDRQELGAL